MQKNLWKINYYNELKSLKNVNYGKKKVLLLQLSVKGENCFSQDNNFPNPKVGNKLSKHKVILQII